MTIDKKMAEYRMQTMRIAEEAQAIERQMEALEGLQVCAERGYHDAGSLVVAEYNPAQHPLFEIESLTVRCAHCGCWAFMGETKGDDEYTWLMEHPTTGEPVTLESFIGTSEEEEPAHTVDLTKPPEGDEDE